MQRSGVFFYIGSGSNLLSTASTCSSRFLLASCNFSHTPRPVLSKIQFKFLNTGFTIFSPLVVSMNDLAIAQCAAVGGDGAVYTLQHNELGCQSRLLNQVHFAVWDGAVLPSQRLGHSGLYNGAFCRFFHAQRPPHCA